MRLAKLIEEYINDQGWINEEVERDEEDNTSSYTTSLSVANQSFRLFIESDEDKDLLFIYLYAPFSVIAGKSVDTALFFNFLNDTYIYGGRIYVKDDGRICYKAIVDVENVEPPLAIIDNMLVSAMNLYSRHIESIAAVALTQKTYEALREEYDKKDAAKEAIKKSKEAEESEE